MATVAVTALRAAGVPHAAVDHLAVTVTGVDLHAATGADRLAVTEADHLAATGADRLAATGADRLAMTGAGARLEMAS